MAKYVVQGNSGNRMPVDFIVRSEDTRYIMYVRMFVYSYVLMHYVRACVYMCLYLCELCVLHVHVYEHTGMRN